MKFIKVFFLVILFCSCTQDEKIPNFLEYDYVQTIQLIEFVENASIKLQNEGVESFFNSKYDKIDNKKSNFIFIYDLNGKCIFHPVLDNLENQDLIEFKDINGKPVIKMIVDIASKGKNQTGWVHYLWTETGELHPLWKSSYIKGVKCKDGNFYAIGSGIYNMTIEKVFIKQMIDSAASLINVMGDSSIAFIKDRSNYFSIYDNYVYAVDFEGKTIIDPSFPNGAGRNILNFKDFTGKFIIKEMIKKLQNQDSAWVMYMWPKPKDKKPSKKLAYIRKVYLNGKPAIIGADLFVAKPIWMKN